MAHALPIATRLFRWRWLPWLVIGLTLGVLGSTIWLARQQLSQRLRDQLAGRDGEILHAVALMELREEVRRLERPEWVADPGTQLTALLKTSQLKGVLAARLYDSQGRFVAAFPDEVRETPLNAEAMAASQALRPRSQFRASQVLEDHFLLTGSNFVASTASQPMLEVNVPLHVEGRGPLLGIAQFLLEGESLAREFARLDQHLNRQALGAFALGGGILVTVLAWAFRRLRQAHRELAERTQNLLQANQELALAAKTSALGAVSAHLIHELKNPLAGLQSLVTRHGATEGEWHEAAATTRRMQAMVAQVVSVLREEGGVTRYEVTVAELVEILRTRVTPLAHEAGVVFDTRAEVEGILPNRTANLVLLILGNLIQNAVEATPSGRRVKLRTSRANGRLSYEVSDEGAGLPEAARRTLFAPSQSTKAGGTGLGLAISKQLANHLGASLELSPEASGGCTFVLTLPETCLAGTRE